ncbi:MAG: MFS transporter [Clostridia bacterium]|jgi:GPH family glycoside/pentoside/hexuronide:cation symporter/probable glucitol transport protein GutA|nr:MFS transporter [Clostridia bacterium]MBQ4244983.1 MFS transporter [Clostridia bacterium]
MSEKANAKPQKYMNLKEILAYSLGLFGFQAIVGLLNSYQAEFYGSIMGANLAIVGAIILIAKIVSAVFDPIVGNKIESTKGKLGKFKPFIIASIPVLLIFTAVVFLDITPLHFENAGNALYIYIFITFLIWCLGMTLADVPTQGIAAVLTPDPNERTNIVSIANTAKQIGFAACAVIVPVICLIIKGGSKVIVAKGEQDSPMIAPEYLFTAIATAVFGCALMALIVFWSKERVPYASGEKTSFKDMFEAIKGNTPLILVIVSYFLGFGRQMAMGIQVQAAYALIGSQNLVIILGITTAIGSMISMAVTPVLIKKTNEKTAYLILSIYGFVVSVLAYIVYAFVTKNAVVMYIFLFLIGLQFSAVTLMPMIMTADCVDYYEYKTGKRTEGPVYALLSLTIKVCLALGTALGLFFVSKSGYSEAIQQSTVVFEESTKNTIFFAYTAMPGILALLSAVPMFKYDIYGKKKEEISAALAERRASAESE